MSAEVVFMAFIRKFQTCLFFSGPNFIFICSKCGQLKREHAWKRGKGRRGGEAVWTSVIKLQGRSFQGDKSSDKSETVWGRRDVWAGSRKWGRVWSEKLCMFVSSGTPVSPTSVEGWPASQNCVQRLQLSWRHLIDHYDHKLNEFMTPPPSRLINLPMKKSLCGILENLERFAEMIYCFFFFLLLCVIYNITIKQCKTSLYYIYIFLKTQCF